VVVFGYVSIIFGRNRASEDIDIILEKISLSKFKKLWEALKGFECIITHDPEEAYKNYLLKETSIRFSEKNKFIPNIELKFPSKESYEIDLYSLNERIEVILNNNPILISPIEMQIAFKFFLGSRKDIEDAIYLYEIFKNNINLALLNTFIKKLKVERVSKRYIK